MSVTQSQPSGYFVYDYFLKDHLSNIRSVVTDEKDTSFYPAASFETAQLANEKLFYDSLDNGRVLKPGGYPTDTYTNPNDYVQKLNGGTGKKTGAAILLKVMAGDRITVRATGWYSNAATPSTPASPLTDIVNSLIATVPGAGGAKFTASQVGGTVLNPSVTGFLSSRDSTNNSARPKAYLNFVLFDEQLNPVLTTDGKNSYFQQVGASGSLSTLSTTERQITKSGYVYIYVSNETPNIDVYFDNLQVTHIKGPLLQEEGYYPFGLEMKAISSQAATKMQTRYKFNAGSELEDNFDINYYETSFRQYDAQIGRFTGIDILAASYATITPYQFGGNNPISINDPTGAAMFYNANYGTRRFEAKMNGMAKEDLWKLGSMDFMGGGSDETFWGLGGGRGGGGPLTDEGLTQLWNSKYGGGWSSKHGYYSFKADLFNTDALKKFPEELTRFGNLIKQLQETVPDFYFQLSKFRQTITISREKPSNSAAIMSYSSEGNVLSLGSSLSRDVIDLILLAPLAHELFHAYQDFSGLDMKGDGNEPDAYIFENLFVSKYQNGDFYNQWQKKFTANSSTNAEINFGRAWNNFFNKGYSKTDYEDIYKYFINGCNCNEDPAIYKGTLDASMGNNLIYNFLPH